METAVQTVFAPKEMTAEKKKEKSTKQPTKTTGCLKQVHHDKADCDFGSICIAQTCGIAAGAVHFGSVCIAQTCGIAAGAVHFGSVCIAQTCGIAVGTIHCDAVSTCVAQTCGIAVGTIHCDAVSTCVAQTCGIAVGTIQPGKFLCKHSF